MEQLFGPGSSAAEHGVIAGVIPGVIPGVLPEGSPRTALPVFQGRPRHLRAHLQRLRLGAEALGRPADWVEELLSPIEAWTEAPGVPPEAALRLGLHPEAGLLHARLEPLPLATQPYLLAPLPHPRASWREDPQRQRLLPHKGLGGAWGMGILAEARALGAADALLFWPDGSLAETAIAAVGVERDGVFALPGSKGRVASLAERLDLPAWAAERGLRVEGVAARFLDLAQAREGRIWCLNALRGIWPAQLL